MLRTIFMIGLFAIGGLFVLKIAFGLFGVALGIFGILLALAIKVVDHRRVDLPGDQDLLAGYGEEVAAEVVGELLLNCHGEYRVLEYPVPRTG